MVSKLLIKFENTAKISYKLPLKFSLFSIVLKNHIILACAWWHDS